MYKIGFSQLLLVSRSFLILSLLAFASASAVQADVVIWEENFDGIVNGPASDAATSVGAGFIDYAGNVSILDGAAVITPDGGNERIEFESNPEAGVELGFFEFDISTTFATDAAGDPVGDTVFVQLVDGIVRNTGGSPQPHFSDNLSSLGNGSFNLSETPTTVRWYFNTSGTDFVYVGPDGVSRTLEDGTYDAYSGTAVNVLDATSGSDPTNVDTAVFTAFNSAAGATFTFDNASLTEIEPIPEPGSVAFMSLLLCGIACQRRRKKS